MAQGRIAAAEIVGIFEALAQMTRLEAYRLLVRYFPFGLYIVAPVIASQFWRHALLANGDAAALAATLRVLGPLSLAALRLTLVILFGLQGEEIMRQPLVIALLATPILIQVYFDTGLAYLLNRRGEIE